MIAIRDRVNALLAHYWGGKSTPIDPEAIAKARGVTVRTLDASESAQGASGWFRVIDGAPTIFYNPYESKNRIRFTIAHELGHYELGHGERPRDSAAAFNVYNFDSKEADANKFAAELLMPEGTVRWLIDRGEVSLERLAGAFAVSEVAMKYRLKNLGLLR